MFSVWAEDNATYRHSVDTQGNITETEQDNQQETDSEMTTSEDLTTGLFLTFNRISTNVTLIIHEIWNPVEL